MRHAFEIARGSHGDYEMAEHYIGFMSKSKIFNSYREVLVDNFSGD